MGRNYDMAFNPNNPCNILITLTELDTSSDEITFPKELIESLLLPLWRSNPFALHPNYVELMDLYEYDTKITATLNMKKDEEGNYKLYGWNNILGRNNFKTGDVVIGFWWDKLHARLNFQLLMIA